MKLSQITPHVGAAAFLATAAVHGAAPLLLRHGQRLRQFLARLVQGLQDDGAVAKITGMKKERLCGEDAFRRLCENLDPAQVEKWFAPAEQMIHNAIPPNCVADWDSTVVVRYGKQEDTAIGYNPQKPGRPSHHPLACVIAGTRLCLHMEWRKGNTVSASGWIDAMEKVWRSPLAQHRSRTAPQLSLSMDESPPWLLFDPTQATQSAVT